MGSCEHGGNQCVLVCHDGAQKTTDTLRASNFQLSHFSLVLETILRPVWWDVSQLSAMITCNKDILN